jgi:ATP-dependent RNA helicase RhlE
VWAEQLLKAGFRATSLQGNLSQTRRQEALGRLPHRQLYRVLVATDIAARGIDVTGISHVINYDMPDTTDAYTHRIGRTGRAERTGEAFTLITSDDTFAVRDVEKVLGYKIERRKLAEFDYTAPAPQRDHEFDRVPRPQPFRRAEMPRPSANNRMPMPNSHSTVRSGMR